MRSFGTEVLRLEGGAAAANAKAIETARIAEGLERMGAGYAEAYGPGEFAGMGVELEAGGARASVALDTNALIEATEGGRALEVLRGRAPNVSITATKEFLAGGGSATELREFLAINNGRVGLAGREATVVDLQRQAAGVNRALETNDARVAASAMREGLPLSSNDKRFGNFLRAIGYTVERF